MMKSKPRPLHLLQLTLTVILLTGSAAAQDDLPDLTHLNMEDLLSLQVTSVGKKPQKVSDTAAAVFVITQQDIRRSGASSVPEVLRMVPGLHVAQLDASKWVVTSRGFSSRYANKLLILVDGRSIYNPMFSGVFWETRDVPLENVERIEVIRGPGASLWGANAVNGIINIVTKKAFETRGTLVTAAGGFNSPSTGMVRHGGETTAGLSYRGYVKYLDRGNSIDPQGQSAADRWNTTASGFRVDWNRSGDALSISGDLQKIGSGEINKLAVSLNPPAESTFASRSRTTSANILTRWNHSFSDDSESTLQFYFDRQALQTALAGEKRDTVDFDFQQRNKFSRHELLWGVNYRTSEGTGTKKSFAASIDPLTRRDTLAGVFLQDEIALVPGRLSAALGGKLDHNSYTGLEFQPNVRLLWTLSKSRTAWLAASKAVRTPSRFESDLRVITEIMPPDSRSPFPIVATFEGGTNLRSESLRAYEIGYREQFGGRLFIEADGFYNIYRHLRTFENGAPVVDFTASPHVRVPVNVANNLEGETYGVEITADAWISRVWHVTGNYSHLKMRLNLAPESTDTGSGKAGGQTPRHQFYVRSGVDLWRTLEADITYRFVGSLPTLQVGSYSAVDARLGWKLSSAIEFSLVGRNLLEPHLEFVPDLSDGMVGESLVKREAYAKISWRF
jgi:iron complex outermembrane receptor protein